MRKVAADLKAKAQFVEMLKSNQVCIVADPGLTTVDRLPCFTICEMDFKDNNHKKLRLTQEAMLGQMLRLPSKDFMSYMTTCMR